MGQLLPSVQFRPTDPYAPRHRYCRWRSAVGRASGASANDNGGRDGGSRLGVRSVRSDGSDGSDNGRRRCRTARATRAGPNTSVDSADRSSHTSAGSAPSSRQRSARCGWSRSRASDRAQLLRTAAVRRGCDSARHVRDITQWMAIAPPSTIHHPPSTIHHPPSTIHHPPSTTIHSHHHDGHRCPCTSVGQHSQVCRCRPHGGARSHGITATGQGQHASPGLQGSESS